MRAQGLLDLNEVLQHPGKKIAVEFATDLSDEQDVELLSAVEGSLEAQSTGNLLLLSGRFRARAIAACARCGAPLEVPVESEVEEQFPVEGVAACYGMNDQARVVPDEPYPLFDGNSLMLDALVRQDLLLAIPLQPLCQYGWEGPCPNALSRPSGAESGGRPEFQKLAPLRQNPNLPAEEPSP